MNSKLTVLSSGACIKNGSGLTDCVIFNQQVIVSEVPLTSFPAAPGSLLFRKVAPDTWSLTLKETLDSSLMLRVKYSHSDDISSHCAVM